jgi:hypothetical protein
VQTSETPGRGILDGSFEVAGRAVRACPSDTRLAATRHPDGNPEKRSTTPSTQTRKGSAMPILPCPDGHRPPEPTSSNPDGPDGVPSETPIELATRYADAAAIAAENTIDPVADRARTLALVSIAQSLAVIAAAQAPAGVENIRCLDCSHPAGQHTEWSCQQCDCQCTRADVLVTAADHSTGGAR